MKATALRSVPLPQDKEKGKKKEEEPNLTIHCLSCDKGGRPFFAWENTNPRYAICSKKCQSEWDAKGLAERQAIIDRLRAWRNGGAA